MSSIISDVINILKTYSWFMNKMSCEHRAIKSSAIAVATLNCNVRQNEQVYIYQQQRIDFYLTEARIIKQQIEIEIAKHSNQNS